MFGVLLGVAPLNDATATTTTTLGDVQSNKETETPENAVESMFRRLQKHYGMVEEVDVEWRDYCILHSNEKDDDDTPVPTLLLSAVSKEPLEPETLVPIVQQVLADYGGDVSCKQSNGTSQSTKMECELWASAPAPLILPPKSHDGNVCGYRAILEAPISAKDELKQWVDWGVVTMAEWGVLIQRQLLHNDDALQELKELVDVAISDTERRITAHHPNIVLGQDTFRFREIASRSAQRFDLRLDDPSCSSSRSIVQFVRDKILFHNTRVENLLQTLLGEIDWSGDNGDVDFDISVVYSRPGACYQGWHADGDHNRGSADAGFAVNGWKTDLAGPYAICLFLPLIDLNETVGYTQFWPGSHRNRDLVGFGKVAELCRCTFDGIVQAGDAIWYDYRLLHRGMPNRSVSTTRPVVQIIFKKKWYIERSNYGSESIDPGSAR